MKNYRFARVLVSTVVTLVLFAAASARAADATITLQDGSTVKGKIVNEDKERILIQMADGESKYISMSKIASIAKMMTQEEAKAAGIVPNGAAVPPAAAPGKQPAANPPIPAEPTVKMDADQLRAMKTTITELGSPEFAKRRTALAKLQQTPEPSAMLMLSMLHPKEKTDEMTRIGILRALAAMAPLSDMAARTIAFDAVMDPYPEVKREACNVIRELADDRAIRELCNYASSQNGAFQQAIAAALHEIDDARVLMALIKALPSPQVVANYGEPTGLGKPAFGVPSGPGGLNMPIFLPSQSITGTASDLDSPAARILKSIAGKDLGNSPYAWLNWFREKSGDITEEERKNSKKRDSVLGKSLPR